VADLLSPHVSDVKCVCLQLVKARPGNDRYVERGMHTFNELPKVKNIQTNKISYSVSRISYYFPVSVRPVC